jgi:hypothetical protein
MGIFCYSGAFPAPGDSGQIGMNEDRTGQPIGGKAGGKCSLVVLIKPAKRKNRPPTR